MKGLGYGYSFIVILISRLRSKVKKKKYEIGQSGSIILIHLPKLLVCLKLKINRSR